MSPPRDAQISDKDSQPGRALGPRFPQRLQGWQTAGGDGRKLGTTVRIVRPPPHRATGRSFPQPCPSDFGRTGPRGRVQRPIVPPPPPPRPLTPGVPLSIGPHGVSGVGRRGLGLVPLSYDKLSSGGSPPPPSRSLGPSWPTSSPLSPPGSPSRCQSALPSASDQGALPACCGSMFRGCSGRIECNLQEIFQKVKGSNILLAAKGKQTQNPARNFLPGAVGRGAGVRVGGQRLSGLHVGLPGQGNGVGSQPAQPHSFVPSTLQIRTTSARRAQGHPGAIEKGDRMSRQSQTTPLSTATPLSHHPSQTGELSPGQKEGDKDPEEKMDQRQGSRCQKTQPLKIPRGVGGRKKDRIACDRTQVRVTTYLWGF